MTAEPARCSDSLLEQVVSADSNCGELGSTPLGRAELGGQAASREARIGKVGDAVRAHADRQLEQGHLNRLRLRRAGRRQQTRTRLHRVAELRCPLSQRVAMHREEDESRSCVNTCISRSYQSSMVA